MKNYNCPFNCPNRSIDPNCHNVDTCDVWKQHIEYQETVKKNRNYRKQQEDDFYGASKRHRKKNNKKFQI